MDNTHHPGAARRRGAELVVDGRGRAAAPPPRPGAPRRRRPHAGRGYRALILSWTTEYLVPIVMLYVDKVEVPIPTGVPNIPQIRTNCPGVGHISAHLITARRPEKMALRSCNFR
eukprot:gene5730-biopygen10281